MQPSTCHYFPITPHLRGSCGTSDDTFMDLQTTQRILSSHVIVQEKLDGLNIGAQVTPDGALVLIQKDRVLTLSELATIPLLENWLATHRRELSDVVGTRLTLFGEYIPKARLPVYAKVPWILFDAYDHMAGRFISQSELRRRAARLPLAFAPTLFEGILYDTAAVENLIQRSHVTCDIMEGVYLRLEHGSFLKERYKFVRRDYVKPS
jgi:hypothetical protein